MRDLYIYGAGGHAKVVAATARLCGYHIGGFWEDSPASIGNEFFGSKIISFDHVPCRAMVFVAFGNNELRLQKGLLLREQFQIATLIHPSAQVAAGVTVGIGSYIGAMANIDPNCNIGQFCIVNNHANISHDSILKDGCHVCGGAQIAGHCCIGNCVMQGIGSCMIENRSIGDHTVIGAGSVVITDIPANVTAVGCPAKVLK